MEKLALVGKPPMAGSATRENSNSPANTLRSPATAAKPNNPVRSPVSTLVKSAVPCPYNQQPLTVAYNGQQQLGAFNGQDGAYSSPSDYQVCSLFKWY